MSRKAGLDGALEFTKFVITLDSALIAFLTGATFLQNIANYWERALVILILAMLALSLGAGIFVYMRAATMLGDGRYELGDPHLRIPGAINVIFFALGAIGLSGLAAFELVLSAPPSVLLVKQFNIQCSFVDQKKAIANCTSEVLHPPSSQK